MPGAQRPRLWLKRSKRFADGYSRAATWVILYRGRHHATGCGESDVEGADRKLQAFIAGQYSPPSKTRSIEKIDVADVIALYIRQIGPKHSDPKKFAARLNRLNDFWAGKMLSEINDGTCGEYTVQRGSRAGARRELEDLRSAVNHHAKQNLHREIVNVTLPPKGEARDRWLTREEAAALLWACWRTREIQEGAPTRKYPLRHLARLILMGLYTGSRYGAIAGASPRRVIGRSWVDLNSGVFHRLKIGGARTNKRQPPVRLPDRLLAHMRRWARLEPDMEYFVSWRGQPIASVKTGFKRAVELAGIEHAYPHALRHTAATWLMQNGVDIWEASGFLGMSEKMLSTVYGHHHPEFQKDAAAALGYRRPR